MSETEISSDVNMEDGSALNQQQKTEPGTESEEQNGAPRVTDRRRYLRLLTEEVGASASADEPHRLPTFVEELEAKVKASEERVRDYAERYRQSREQMDKEVEGIRERLGRTLEERLDQSRAHLIRNLLEVKDNLRRAMQPAEAGQSASAILEGLRATLHLFEKSLEAEGVRVIDPVGEAFDPNLHEAVDTLPADPEEDGRVMMVTELGYSLKAPDDSRRPTLIRPAKVRVGKSRTE